MRGDMRVGQIDIGVRPLEERPEGGLVIRPERTRSGPPTAGGTQQATFHEREPRLGTKRALTPDTVFDDRREAEDDHRVPESRERDERHPLRWGGDQGSERLDQRGEYAGLGLLMGGSQYQFRQRRGRREPPEVTGEGGVLVGQVEISQRVQIAVGTVVELRNAFRQDLQSSTEA